MKVLLDSFYLNGESQTLGVLLRTQNVEPQSTA